MKLSKEFPEKLIKRLYFYILSFMIIVSTRGIWLYESNAIITYGQLSRLILGALIVGLIAGIFYKKKIKITKTVCAKALICLFFMLIYFPMAGSSRLTFLQLYLLPVVCAALLLCVVKNTEEVWKYYSDVVIVLAAISLLFYIGGSVLNIIPSTGTTTFVWAYVRQCKNYFGLYYEASKLNGAFFSIRNCGIFTEPPMYNFVLCTALASEMFLNRNSTRLRQGILLVTILTTMSTTGYIVVVAMFFMKYAGDYLTAKKMTVKKLLLPLVLLAGAVVICVVMVYRSSYSSGVNSNNVRFDHLSTCMSTWFHNFIFGCGYLNSSGVLENASYEQGISVGLPYMLATGGIVLASTLLLPYIINAYDSVKNHQMNYFFFDTVVIVLYFFTAVTGTPVMAFFIAYMVAHDRRREEIAVQRKKKKICIEKAKNA